MRKFIGSIEEEDMQIIEQAAKIERMPRYVLIRRASVEYAKKILKNKEKENATTD